MTGSANATFLSVTLVWIDAREAVIVRWHKDQASIEHVGSEVPPHHAATGHLTDDTAAHHSGGRRPSDAGEAHRLEHLARFVEDIATRIPPDDDLVIVGPGVVHERLERSICESDGHRRPSRTITCESSPKRSDRQLVAMLRRAIGKEPRRQAVGGRRRAELPCRLASGEFIQPSTTRHREATGSERWTRTMAEADDDEAQP